MYAYSYGERNFAYKYANTNNVIVFNDTVDFLKEEEINITDNGFFVKVTPLETGKFIINEDYLSYDASKYYKEQNSIKKLYDVDSKEFDKDSLDKLFENTNLNSDDVEFFELYVLKDEFYIFVNGNYLDEVIVTANVTGSKKRKQAPIEIVNDYFKEQKLTVFLFVSENGAKLEKAFQDIELLDNELIFLLEKNTGNNLFGTVVRVMSGSKFSANTILPASDLKKILRKLDTARPNAILKVYKKHFEDKANNEKLAYILFNKILSTGVEVLSFPTAILADGLSQLFTGIGSLVGNLSLDKKRWKYYEAPNKKSKDFDPFLPKALFNFDEYVKDLSFGKNGKLFEDEATKLILIVDNRIPQIKNTFEDFGNYLEKVWRNIKKLLIKFTQAIDDFIKDFIHMAKDEFLFLHAIIVGVWNSLIEAIKGIFDLVGMLFALQKNIVNASKKAVNNIASYISMSFESIENLLQVFRQLFKKETIKLIITFFGKLIDKASESIIKITPDVFGYYLGFAIGFIVEEILLALATGGVKNVATLLDKIKDSFTTVTKIIGGATEAVKKQLKDIATATATGILGFIDFLLKQTKPANFKKLLDNIYEFIVKTYFEVKLELTIYVNGLQRTLKMSILPLDEVFNLIAKKLTQANRKRIQALGIKFSKDTENKGLFNVIYTLADGTKDVLRLNKKELKDIIANLTKGKLDDAKKYLDELFQKEKFKRTKKLWDDMTFKDFIGPPPKKPCFLAGTLVHTTQGLLPIENISNNMEVLCYNEVTQILTQQKVTKTYTNSTLKYAHIVTEAGNEFKVTGQHLFYQKSSGTWIKAHQLKIGMHLYNPITNSKDKITSKEVITTQETTYNLEVPTYHNYIVGKQGVLAHNANKRPSYKDPTKREYSFYGLEERKAEDLYVGKTTREDINIRTSEHIQEGKRAVEKGIKPQNAWKYLKQIQPYYLTFPIRSVKMTEFESAVWERYFIEEKRAGGIKLENKQNPLGKNLNSKTFAKYKKYWAKKDPNFNPCKYF